jgi:NADH:ubiquinone oxidoreductase subunit 4 (subunit M)
VIALIIFFGFFPQILLNVINPGAQASISALNIGPNTGGDK